MRLLISLLLIICTSCYSSSFDNAINFVLSFEGNMVVKTQLEYTKYGITQEILYSYNKEYDVYWEVSSLTKKQAKQVAYAMFWDKMNLEEIKNERIAIAVFDFNFHSNSNTAMKIIQRVLNDIIYEKRRKGKKSLTYLVEDGRIGYRTIEALNSVNEKDFIKRYKVARLCYLQSLPQWNEYDEGWRKRVNKI